MREIILASASPRRRDLLRQAGIPFRVQPSDIEEGQIEPESTPERTAGKLALLKASDVAEKLDTGLVLGADTIVVVDGEIFGKPVDDEDAFRMLTGLNGREHLVITGIALVDMQSGLKKSAYETTRVFFTTLSTPEIEAYIRTGEPRGKAGAYAVQGMGALLVERIEGCYSNVVGLPLIRLRRLLEEFGEQVL